MDGDVCNAQISDDYALLIVPTNSSIFTHQQNEILFNDGLWFIAMTFTYHANSIYRFT